MAHHPSRTGTTPRSLQAVCAIGVAASAATALAASSAGGACAARSGPNATPVVELYTSEGCSSCPPADRWLATFEARHDVVALAFHVDYWDRLGWKDRFASPAFTRRQVQQQAVNGARFAYTPQVVVNGEDRKDWPRVRVAASSAASPISIELSREGDLVVAKVQVVGEAPPRLAAYWAITESGHRTAVQAGENAGAMLQHAFVVRELEPVTAWPASRGAAQPLRHALHAGAAKSHAQRVNLVVTNAAGGQPLQALALDCP